MVSVKTNNWNRSNILLWDGERWVYEPHGDSTYIVRFKAAGSLQDGREHVQAR